MGAQEARMRQEYWVLIVPLWNWNMDAPLFYPEFAPSSNRTFMELKLQERTQSALEVRKVLIVPLWNWNPFACFSFTQSSSF